MEIEVVDGFEVGDAPAGITIRLRVEADDRAIVAVMADGFGEPWDYGDTQREFLLSETYDPTVWFVALDGNEMVGPYSGT
jgi:predicted N-acetyltransferase YhbS